MKLCHVIPVAFLVTIGRPVTGDELIIVSPHSPEIRAEFSRGFSRWHAERTGITVDVKWLDVGGTGQAIEYVRSRNATKRQAGGVDLFFGGGNFPFIKLHGEGLLAPHAVPAEILQRIPSTIHGSRIHGSDSLWYGAALSGFGILCNLEIARRNGLQPPETWQDLARREYRGWVSSGDPRYSGSIHMMYEILLQAYGWHDGWDIIARMSANLQSFEKGASSAAKAVSAGQAAFGLAIDFYAFIEIERYGAARLAFVFPTGETVVNADGIAILRNAPSPALAASFLDYVLSEGQKLWILKPGEPGGPHTYALCRFPVDSTLYGLDSDVLTVGSNPYELESTLDYDGRLAGKRWSILGDLVAAFIIVPHRELKACWREVIRRGLTPRQARPYFTIEIDEKECLLLTEQWSRRDFAQKRVRLMNAWTARAKKRYASVFKP